ncbi:MAG: GGDEF domain-containing protein [Pseudomonadota bacterium]
MKVGDPPKPSPPKPVSRNMSASSPVISPTREIDEALLAGIPEAELTPKVRETLITLLQEVKALRLELAAAQSKIAETERLADRDPLLDINNRRAFVRELNRMLAMVDRYGIAAALVFIDVNEMKQINDQYGHGAGDAALARVAEVISGNIRQTDAAGRLGGDEFGLILTQVDRETALSKASDLASQISASPVNFKANNFSVSVSVGAIEITRDLDAADALERADAAMYEAKRAR